MGAKTALHLSLCAAIVASGCSGKKEVTYVPMGADAPAFGSANLTSTEAFLPGRWCLCSITNNEFSKQLGVESITEDSVDTTIVYVFKPEGTFTVTNSEVGWKVDGSWQKMPNAVVLKYEKVDGLPWDKAEIELQKKAESGRQSGILTEFVYEPVFRDLPKLNALNLAGDQKRLIFEGGTRMSSSGMDEQQVMQLVSSKGLVRMKEKT